MNEYSVARAKAKFSEMLAKVRAGREEVVITRARRSHSQDQ